MNINTPIEEPKPNLSWLKPLSIMYTTIDLAWVGTSFPLYITNTSSNIWNEPIETIIQTNSVTGANWGRVTYQNWCHAVAPSIFAASYKVLSINCKPAKK